MSGSTERVRALARVVVEQVDFDTVGADLEVLNTELVGRNGEAPVELADELSRLVTYVPSSMIDAAEWAVGAADELLRSGQVPVGVGGRDRAMATTAGWLLVGTAVNAAPSALASVLSVPSAARTVLRVLADGVGPFGRLADGGYHSARYRSGGTILVGVPGSGKTELLAYLAATASGPVVATTPLPADVARFAARASDHEVLVFDPAGLLGGHAPPGARIVTVNLIDAVTDWASAGRVAANLVDAANVTSGGGVNEAFWRQASKQAIRIRMFAAAMNGYGRRTMKDVLAWLGGRSAEAEVMGILTRSGVEEAALAYAAEMGMGDDRTYTNVLASARSDLEPYVNVTEGGEPLDMGEFVAGNGTLVMIADPLSAAPALPAVGLATRYLIEARFKLFHSGRSGTPMLVLADEVVRMPAIGNGLGELLAVGSSRSVNIVAACQATRQLDALPGGAEEMLTAAGRSIFFPGSISAEVLRLAAFLQHSHPTSMTVTTDGDTLDVAPRYDFDPARLARPEPGTVNVLEDGVFTPVAPHAAHREPLWRLAGLDAAFSRTGLPVPESP